jgi:hypothetical protein
VVVLHRPFRAKRVRTIKKLKMAGTKVVVDNDDTYQKNTGTVTDFSGFSDEKMEMYETINKNLQKAFQMADLVTTSTKTLQSEYKQLNDNVTVLPNMIEPFDWSEPKRNDGNKVRVGLWGSVASNGEYMPASDCLGRLSERKDVQLVVMASHDSDTYADDRAYWGQLNVEKHPHIPMADFQDYLNNLKLDIAMIPRQENYFNRCKSNIKFLEASMLEIPVVAQSFAGKPSPYEKDYKAVKLANTQQEWTKQVMELVKNETKRRNQGQNAKQYVLDNYDINDNINMWKDAYKSLI